MVSVVGACYFTQKVLEVPVHELGHVHYVLGVILWANVIANIPFHLVIDTRQFYFFNVIFDAFQLCTVMMVHLLFNRILTFKAEDHKKYYLGVGAYCYLLIFIMLVTKDVLKNILTTLNSDGSQKIDFKTVREFKISLVIVLSSYVLLAIPTQKDHLRNRNFFTAFSFIFSVALAIS